MKESGYYPPGAEFDNNAPYNQRDQEPVEVEVVISQTLSRVTTIKVTDYTATEWEDCERDEDGGYYKTGGTEYDLSDSDLQGAYKVQECDISELLDYLKVYLIKDIASCPKEGNRKKKLQHILSCCEGWEVDETEVIEN